MSKNIFLGFIPWILFLILAGHTAKQFDAAIIISLIASIVCQLRELKKGYILSWGSLLFFTFMSVSVIIFVNPWVIRNAGLISNSALTIIVLFSIIIGKPFTIQYAKETVPASKWQHPLFIRINYILSLFWLVMFLSGLLLYLAHHYYSLMNNWSYALVSYIPIILGTLVSIRFPNWYRTRYTQKHTPKSKSS